MIKKIVFLAIFFLINLVNGVSISENIDGRNALLEKYKSSKTLYNYLQVILKPNLETQEGVNNFYNSFDKLRTSSNPKATEILVDLLDFYVGETPSAIIDKAIIEKGGSALPLLRKKLIDPVISNEMPNETDTDAILEKRNEEIISLMQHIYFQIPYAYEYTELNTIQLTKVKLFNIQKLLHKYYLTTARYPFNLNELRSKENDSGLDLTVDAWNRPFRYKSGIGFYFLDSKGLDGLSDTQDDLYAPICPELHKFP